MSFNKAQNPKLLKNNNKMVIRVRLPEFKSKQIFEKAGIPIPLGKVIYKKDWINNSIDWSDVPVPGVVKAQNMIGGRGKAGGILKGETLEQIISNVNSLFKNGFSDNTVDVLLIEELLDIESEAYLSISVDRRERRFSIMGTNCGGIEIESLSHDQIAQEFVSPLLGCRNYHISPVIKKICEGKENNNVNIKAKDILINLYSLFIETKALLVEINPLVFSKKGDMVAADAKIIIDDNSDYLDKIKLQDTNNQQDNLQFSAKELGVNLVVLDGDIAVISNGAGEGMATIDQIVSEGGSVGIWADLAGGALSAKPETFAAFLNSVIDAKPKVILFTAFFQIGKADLFAQSILDICNLRKDKPLIILRLDGNNADIASEILKGSDLIMLNSSIEACKKAAEIATGIKA